MLMFRAIMADARTRGRAGRGLACSFVIVKKLNRLALGGDLSRRFCIRATLHYLTWVSSGMLHPFSRDVT